MPRRKTLLIKDQIYHVFNRGVGKSEIFRDGRDYSKFLSIIKHYIYYPHRTYSHTLEALDTGALNLRELQLETVEHPLVDIINFCLMPNHFHLTLYQNLKGGITKFMQIILNSYSHYFSVKYDWSGALFQGRFKAVLVETKEQLIHLSRYVHINPKDLIKGEVTLEKLLEYPWSSLRLFLGKGSSGLEFCNKRYVMENFSGPEDYSEFLMAEVGVDEMRIIEDLVIDN